MSGSTDAASGNIIDKVIAALGSRLNASEEIKRSFAEAILRKLAFSEIEEETLLPEMGEAFLDGAQQLEESIKYFKQATGGFEGYNLKGIAFKDRPYILEDLLARLKIFKQEAKVRTAARGRGPNNIRALKIAKLIAVEYKQHFGRYPKTGKEETVYDGPKQLPYDRVCNVLKSYSPTGKIPASTRVIAINEVKNGGGIRPRKTM